MVHSHNIEATISKTVITFSYIKYFSNGRESAQLC